ncbi:hypothetical protein [Oceanidesulfovibrio marinus]|uniref:Uncharacterized protein n=1 Tax=Oceanidesulfovibrio marinus TaxID=370038 RepID=A0ABX6NFP9_9BACT|nr:hypothetical protein [Oceanidesulfovibrio marinus]QJT09451.1 hypothetical protein E8L03_11095 [Oceanidesulfovibrio marinus]
MSEQAASNISPWFVLAGTLGGYVLALVQTALTHHFNSKLEIKKLTHIKEIEAHTSVLLACDRCIKLIDPTDSVSYQEVKAVYLPEFEKVRKHYAYLDRQIIFSVELLLDHFRSYLLRGHPDLDVSASVLFVEKDLYSTISQLKKHVIKQLTKKRGKSAVAL